MDNNQNTPEINTEFGTHLRVFEVSYEYFPIENHHVLSVAEGDSCINMFNGKEALEMLAQLTTVK